MIEWRFKPNSRDDMDVDPVQTEFFTTKDVDNISTAVIREGIQNALDERNKGQTQTVKVRIFLSGNKYALTPKDYKPLLASLEPHLKAKTAGIRTLPDFTSSMRFLIFEDFNTNGLEGDPEESFVENINDKKPHNFYYFWRNVGRSGKTDDQLGRWGLGKTVFPASSAINTFWGITVRKSDGQKLLMGQCILRIHTRDDQKGQKFGYRPYGMYGSYQAEDFFSVPVDDKTQISTFENLFRLDRKQTSGLSLIIPFHSEEITIDHLAYSVIEQYFYPIFEGKLEVEIVEEDTTIALDRNSIEKSIDKINFRKLEVEEGRKIRSKEAIYRLFDFTKWTFQLRDTDFFRLEALEVNHKPRWNKSLFSDELALNIIRDKFERNERVAFRIPLKYHLVGAKARICWFDAFLEKDTGLVRPENHFVRDGITITGINSLDKGPVRGMVIIHDHDLARMLGDSENPAHTEWQPDSRNFKGKYQDGKEALVFIKSTLRILYDKLQRPIEGIQKDLLMDYFSIPVETTEDKPEKIRPKKDKAGDETDDMGIPEIVRKKTPVLTEKITAGLKIYKNPAAHELPESIRLKLGYDVPRGNPISSYQELDFDLSKTAIKIIDKGVNIIKKERNELEFEIDDTSYFEIALTGFDEKRDLFLKLM